MACCCIEKQRSPPHVDVDIFDRSFQARTDTGERCEMNDRIEATPEDPIDQFLVTDVAARASSKLAALVGGHGGIHSPAAVGDWRQCVAKAGGIDGDGGINGEGRHYAMATAAVMATAAELSPLMATAALMASGGIDNFALGRAAIVTGRRRRFITL